MKDNRKNRKLNFITIKNRLRTGVISFYGWEKTSEALDAESLEKLVNTVKSSLLKIYKLRLPEFEIKEGYHGDDFINNVNTYQVRLFLK